MKTDINIEQIKRYAKKVKKAEGITHTQALEKVAREQGFQNWQHLLNNQKPVSF